ncbi:unnamed protein product [Closterium sp. Naga37s-1]|nr:unnamed protein product [Closterium sp. Naga37s-1]
MGAPLGLIERMEPQLAGLLLSRCISRRVSYLARTTPLPFLPKEEWSEWGRRLLETLLTACGINHPRGDEETSRTWAQASLPISLGGLGLTDPSVEGSYSFLASYTQAQLLLDSLDSECSGPLEVTRELMRGPYTDAPGSPWALASSAGGMQTREIGEPTLPDHEEQGGDVAERTGPTGPRHPRQQSQSPQAADELSAPGIPQDYGAGARREERLEQQEEQIARTTPHGSGGELSPHRPISSGLAPSRKAPDAQPRRDRNPPVAHDAHAHSRSNAQATVGETGPADAGGQRNAPCDEESRAAGASQEGENVAPRTDIQTHDEQAIADERSGERENGGDTSGGHGNGSVTPCAEEIEETAVITETAEARVSATVVVAALPPTVVGHRRTMARRMPPVRHSLCAGARDGPHTRRLPQRQGSASEQTQIPTLILKAPMDLVRSRRRSNRHARGRTRGRKWTGSRINLHGAVTAQSTEEVHRPPL